MSIYFLLSLSFLVLIQGGYYPQTYIIVGIVSVIMLVIRCKRLYFTRGHAVLMILAVLYVISAVVNGMSYSLISKAMLPLALFVIAVFYSSLDMTQKSKLLNYIAVAGVLSAAAGLIMYFGMSDNELVVAGKSLMFTFQYANAAGCWYAACFVLAFFSENKYIRYSSVFCLPALLCTRSYGAVIILAIMLLVHGFRSEFFCSRFRQMGKIKYVIIVFGVIGCFAAVLLLYKLGAGTFQERIVHTYDGLSVLYQNIVFGIGPDNWRYVFPFYQTAYYPAGVIHNSYVQTGVDAGVMAMIILIATLVYVIYRYIRYRTVSNLAALIIMLHSLMEYNMYFASIDVLLIYLVMYETPLSKENISGTVCRPVVAVMGMVVICLMSFSFYGTLVVRQLESYSLTGDADMTERIYEDNALFMKGGYKESEVYGICSLVNGENHSVEKQSAKYKRYKMIYCDNADIDIIQQYIEEQKYYRNVRIEAAKLVNKLKISDEKKENYYEYVNAIDDSLEGWYKRIIQGE